MTSKNITSIELLEDEDMEDIQLHRAESMSSAQVVIFENKNDEKIKQENLSVTSYLGSKGQLILSEMKNMKIEPVMFFYMFSYVLRSITSTTMIMEKVCEVHLGNSDEVCNDLSSYPEIKIAVEKMANNYHLGHTLVQLTPSAVLSLFIGAWSDKYSRKAPLIAALAGIILDGLGTIVCAYYMHSRVEYYFIPAIFTGISGGFIGVLMVIYSYSSDISTASNRTMKYAILHMTFSTSMPLGNVAGGWIFKYYGYIPVFLTSTCGHILGLCWVIFILEETRGLDNKDSWMVKLRNFWTFNSVVSSYKATIKQRPNKGREQIWLLIVAMSIGVFNLASAASVTYFFVHHQYNWDNTTYSTVTAIFAILGSILMVIVVPLCRKFNFGDPYLGIIGSVSLLLKNIIVGLAYQKWIYYVANLLGLLCGLETLAARSRISKVVSKEDLGKVFAFLTSAESLVPLIAIAIVSQTFNASLEFFPGLIFVVMGVMIIIPLAIYIWTARLPSGNYEDDNENLQTEKAEHADEKVIREKGEKSTGKY